MGAEVQEVREIGENRAKLTMPHASELIAELTGLTGKIVRVSHSGITEEGRLLKVIEHGDLVFLKIDLRDRSDRVEIRNPNPYAPKSATEPDPNLFNLAQLTRVSEKR